MTSSFNAVAALPKDCSLDGIQACAVLQSVPTMLDSKLATAAAEQ